MTATIERLDTQSFDSMADVLARAFFDDPGYAWIFPDPVARARGLAWLHRRLVRLLHAKGTCTNVTDDGTPIAGALWIRGDVAIDPVSLARFGLFATPFRLGPATTVRLLRSLAHVEKIKADTMRILGKEGWFLDHLAVDPSCQGRGLGAKVVRGGPEGDGREVGIGLLTATEKNLRFYRGLGFEIRAEERCGGKSGFTTWTLVREAKDASSPRTA